MSDVMNESLYRNFVSPALCKDLHEFGLQVKLSCHWNQYDCPVLKCYLFDFEDYYVQNDKNVDHLNPPNASWPAFQIGDLDLLLPDYYISRTTAGFYISIDQMFNVQAAIDRRLPDAFARLVISCIRHRIILPSTAISTLTAK